jgi:hypothetical protein
LRLASNKKKSGVQAAMFCYYDRFHLHCASKNTRLNPYTINRLIKKVKFLQTSRLLSALDNLKATN